MTRDGVENGYFLFDFNWNDYNYRFVPANRPRDFQMRISVADTLAIRGEEAPRVGKFAFANVFAASPQSEVTLTVGDKRIKMQRHRAADPFLKAYFEQNKESVPGWIRKSVSDHLWVADIKGGLAPGLHTLRVEAVDHKNNHYSGSKIIEVK